ncbi:MAG: PcfB family protein [Ruminococcus sp.]
MTRATLLSALKDFMAHKSTKKGKTTYSHLVQEAHGKLESIEVTESNIKDFQKVAAKYDINFALKRDKSTQPPTYHVFFASASAKNFNKAFTEYLAEKSPHQHQFNIEKLQGNAQTISKSQSQQQHTKRRVKKREVHL